MKVALTYNLKKQDDTKRADYFSEYDSADTINAIVSALEFKGHTVEAIEAENKDLFSYFRRRSMDIVFNIAEGKCSRFREAEIPAMLDFLKIPYTGSNTFSLNLALNKAFTKKILQAEGITTPPFKVFMQGDEELDDGLKFPLIVKPNCEGSAKGISVSSVVWDPESLYKKVKEIIEVYRQEALVEEFIYGRELTVGILENGKISVLPILEIDFSRCAKSGDFFYTWRMKEYQGNRDLGLDPVFHCPAHLDKETQERVKEIAVKTHQAVGCYGISRTDIRLDKNNVPYVLEINPLPGLDPSASNFPLMAYAAGMKYEDLIEAVLLSASERKGWN